MKKSVLLISAILTTFTLLAVAGVVYSLNQNISAQAAADPTPQSVAPAMLDPNLERSLAEREASYRRLVDEANARLEQAQGEIQQLRAQLDAVQAGTDQTDPQAVISIERAAQIAADYLGQSEIYSGETVMEGGRLAAYQITFSSGDVVYVSPVGSVISTRLAARTQVSAAGGEREHEEGHEEHEGREDDD